MLDAAQEDRFIKTGKIDQHIAAQIREWENELNALAKKSKH